VRPVVSLTLWASAGWRKSFPNGGLRFVWVRNTFLLRNRQFSCASTTPATQASTTYNGWTRTV